MANQELKTSVVIIDDYLSDYETIKSVLTSKGFDVLDLGPSYKRTEDYNDAEGQKKSILERIDSLAAVQKIDLMVSDLHLRGSEDDRVDPESDELLSIAIANEISVRHPGTKIVFNTGAHGIMEEDFRKFKGVSPDWLFTPKVGEDDDNREWGMCIANDRCSISFNDCTIPNCFVQRIKDHLSKI